jgi:hypothetical protein
MSSATEAVLGAMFINCREAIPTCQALEMMRHTTLTTLLQTDNNTALIVVTNNIASKHLESVTRSSIGFVSA